MHRKYRLRVTVFFNYSHKAVIGWVHEKIIQKYSSCLWRIIRSYTIVIGEKIHTLIPPNEMYKFLYKYKNDIMCKFQKSK